MKAKNYPPPREHMHFESIAAVSRFYADYSTFLYKIKYQPCCTTKHIFWLGKNKFI